jgi:Flp pilus assembly protein TadG
MGRAPGSTALRRPLCAAPARRPPLADDAGAVTVEAALALCALTVFLALAMGALLAVAQAMRCADAARELARLAARGEPDRGRAVAARLAPSGARLELVQDGDTVTALVSARLVGPLPLAVDGRAVAALEEVGSP